MSGQGEELTFWDHLKELRVVLLRILIVVCVVATGVFLVMPWIFDHIILWPCRPDFPLYSLLSFMHGDGQFLPDMGAADFSLSLINIKLGTQLLTHMSASLWLSVAICFPIVIYLLWTFVSPGLYERERRGAKKAFLFGNIMFYLGLLVGYFIVFPLALRFLSQYELSHDIANQLTLDSYMDNFYTITVSMGVVFEMPLLAWMLGKTGILTRSFFTRNRRYAVFAMCLIAAIITPTSDLFTLAVVFVPLYALWEFSALLVPRQKAEDQ